MSRFVPKNRRGFLVEKNRGQESGGDAGVGHPRLETM